jgi:hypothetical protein
MNWWPFHDECKQDIAKMQDCINMHIKTHYEDSSAIDALKKEVSGYKCTLELKLNEINELKAIYNYQVADLEGKIKQLSDENDVLFKANKELLEGSEKVVELPSHSDKKDRKRKK